MQTQQTTENSHLRKGERGGGEGGRRERGGRERREREKFSVS